MTTAIPVIDLEPAIKGSASDKRAVAAQIDRTCTDIGFFTIKGHGVSLALINELRDKANVFFALPLNEKLKAAPADGKTPRGYRALGSRRCRPATPSKRRTISRSIITSAASGGRTSPTTRRARDRAISFPTCGRTIQRASATSQRNTTARWKSSPSV